MKRSAVLSLAFGLLASVACAQDLTVAELSRRPELWPKQTTLKQPVKLQGHAPLNPGQKLTVVSLRGTQVELETPNRRSVFDAPVDHTDLLAVAQAAAKKLTPEQRALTYAQLLQRKDLWTYRVKLTAPQQLSGGELKAGESAILVGVEGSDLLVAYEKGNFLFNVAPRDTDLLDSARQLLVDQQAFPSRVAGDLQGKLVDPRNGSPVNLAVAAPTYYAFYRGAGWCGPCRQFSPALVKTYQQLKGKHTNFELVFISGDKAPAEMAGYAKEAGFAWSAVPQARQPQMQIVNRLFTNLIPQFVVTDAQGNVLIDSARSNPPTALKQFESLLKKSS